MNLEIRTEASNSQKRNTEKGFSLQCMVTMASMKFGYEFFHAATETAEQQLQYSYSFNII